MKAEECFTKEQFVSVLDNSPTAVYISAVDTYEMLYANHAAKTFLWHRPENIVDVTRCYETAGFTEPCPFCRAREMSRSVLLVRDFHNPINGRIYQLSGKLIDWGGTPAHIEYIEDITEKRREEELHKKIEEEMLTTFSSIPCGLCVYEEKNRKIIPVFHNKVFYEIMGFSDEHIRKVEQETTFQGVHPEDLGLLREKIEKVLRNGGVTRHTYRYWNDRNGEYRWINMEGAVRTGEDGRQFLYGVYSDVSEQKRLETELTDTNRRMRETRQELDHLVNSIPGGIASYRVEGERFYPLFYSDGVPALTGHTRVEYDRIVCGNALNIVYEPDRERILALAPSVMEKGTVLEISYRLLHKDGSLVWVHLNGRRMGPLSADTRVYAVFTGMSAETRLFQSISNELVDGIYIINRENYELLYAHESKELFTGRKPRTGEKCYAALHGECVPCENCILNTYGPDGKEHEIEVTGTDKVYTCQMRETKWNGIPAYVQYIRDVTEEKKLRREKKRLEVYYQTLVKNLPGGISVVRCEPDGRMTPEFISEGFAAMTHMSEAEVRAVYENNIFGGVHPEDAKVNREKLRAFMARGEGRLDLTSRMRRGGGGYIWIKSVLSMLRAEGGAGWLYVVYTDITKTMEEQEQLRRHYENLILQHYRTPDSNTLLLGHSNITKNRVLEMWDILNSEFLKTFGDVREEFFTRLSGIVAGEDERRAFLDTYLNAPVLAAFQSGVTEIISRFFIQLPGEKTGRYAEIKLNMAETPGSGDVVGILTVTDITEETIADKVLQQLSVTSYDLVLDVDLYKDQYTVLTCNQKSGDILEESGCHSEQIRYMLQKQILPKDRESVARKLEPAVLLDRLKRDGSISLSYAITGENGDVLTKKLTISAIDLRLGRVCFARTDITASVREQQGLLHMIAYTFDLICFYDIGSGNVTIYTRQMVLQNLPPEQLTPQDFGCLTGRYGLEEDREEVPKQFALETIRERLEKEPTGYDIVLVYRGDEGLRYKQVNVLWGDENHRTICLVRADVTDILTAERTAKQSLEEALANAEKANRAKSDFLSAMSHDIRTPMNAIMGMTTLALAHLNDRIRVADCLQKISISNRHLLSLINDVLDMSRIEQSKIVINRIAASLPELLEQLSAIIASQAQSAGLRFVVQSEGIGHEHFYGDSLRVSQILLNLLSNAVKFTPEGGQVDFMTEEIPPRKAGQIRYRFTVSDTGVGMQEEFLPHIFEPFARSQNSLRVEGTGLGLAITKGLVELMGGKISVESRPAKGSTFRVELEFESASAEADARLVGGTAENTGEAKEKPFAGRTFLIVEDNGINAEILCELLSLYGADSVVKTDGGQAVQEFCHQAPGTYDVVLMDIQMPKMNGYEAARAIRELDRPDAKTIPIAAMTANAFAEDIQKAKEAGMNAHVAKPIDVEVLRATLGELLHT